MFINVEGCLSGAVSQPLGIFPTDFAIHPAFECLQKASASSAFHNSKEHFDPPKCHPNTRLAVLERIMAWILRQEDWHVYIMWLYGGAGTGKSAIAQSIAEWADAEMCLVSSFFFSRSDPSQNDGDKLMATIAHQICRNVPGARYFIEAAINEDPLIFECSLQSQLTSLIIEPLRQHQIHMGYFSDPANPRLVIIDGLDECRDPDVQCNILDVISNVLGQNQLPLLFLIASRPEQHISSTINSRKFTQSHARLALNDTFHPDEDIRRFLQDSFDEIKETHSLKAYLAPTWPSLDAMETLIEKSSGHFIYASIVVRYVKSPRHWPSDHLEVILGLRPALHDTPFAEHVRHVRPQFCF
ncbi:hypothetical protein BDZ97DRAFT_1666289 [Flammula alnicola]|nr:hypothetical protein BDZ97DRAFT_1666289 [Flammula alnicola]